MSSLRQAQDRPERQLRFDCSQVIYKAREGADFVMLSGQEFSRHNWHIALAAQQLGGAIFFLHSAF